MIEFPTPKPEAEELEELSNIIVLNDQDGNPVEFEFLDLIEYEGGEYVVLMPMEGNELMILKVEAEDPDSEEETYVGIADEELLQTVFGIFKEKYKDVFTFTEE